MIKYFLKTWIIVAVFILFCYGIIRAHEVFMDWVFTHSEQQILTGALIFVATITASMMAWLRSLGILS